MITNISDRKDTSFLSINKAISNKIKFSLLKKVFFLYFEWHFHEFLESCSILEYNNFMFLKWLNHFKNMRLKDKG